VVADLQQVYVPDRPARQKHRLDGQLRVAGEERAESATAELRHDRSVVDVPIRERRRRVRRRWVHDRQPADRVEAQELPGACQGVGGVGLGACQRDESVVGGVRVLVPRLQDEADPISLEDRHQARDVVLVRVGEQHDVDSSLPPGQPLAQPTQQQLRVGTAIDQQGRPRWSAHQDRVTLADIERDDMEPPVRQPDERRDREQGSEGSDTDRGARDLGRGGGESDSKSVERRAPPSSSRTSWNRGNRTRRSLRFG